MKNTVRFLASSSGRLLRACIGFAILAWGYNRYHAPSNIILMFIGLIVILAAVLNILPPAVLFGYPMSGKKIIEKYGPLSGVPGEDLVGERILEKTVTQTRNERKGPENFGSLQPAKNQKKDDDEKRGNRDQAA